MRESPYPLAMKMEPSGAGTAAVRRHSLGDLNPASRGSSDFQHHRAVGFHFYKQPVLCGRALLHGSVEELLSVLFGVNHRMNFGIGIGYGPDQAAIAVVNEHSGCALGADVDVASFVLRDRAMRSSEVRARRQRSPIRYNFISPFAIAGQYRRRNAGDSASAETSAGNNAVAPAAIPATLMNARRLKFVIECSCRRCPPSMPVRREC